ncbi:MAG TPA: glutamine synthetase type III, partial [Chitinophagaceae bacterium]|nr:glutamine synthetase type III [Chitinophagaceae bacterium]
EKVLFEGDGYSQAWEQEAEKRGLANVKTTPQALDAMVTDKAKNLFESNKIYSHSELEARHEIELEKYIKKVQIESRIMGELATSHILPAAIRYQTLLANNIQGLKEAGLSDGDFANQKQILVKISEHINKASDLVEKMIQARKKANTLTDTREKAIAYQGKIKDVFFDEIRYHVDKLELLVDDREWYLPKYRELLFLR